MTISLLKTLFVSTLFSWLILDCSSQNFELAANWGNQGISIQHRAGFATNVNQFATETADGSIIAVSRASTLNETGVSCLIKLTPDGQLDNTFGDDGWVSVSLIPGMNSIINSVVTDDSGHIYAGGIVTEILDSTVIIEELDTIVDYDLDWNFGIMKFHPNGIIDESFGTEGRLIFDAGFDYYEGVKDMEIINNHLIVLGESFINERRRVVLASFSLNGQIDSEFGQNGMSRAVSGNTSTMLKLDDDSFLVAGWHKDSITQVESAGIFKFKIDGNLDSTFADNGWALLKECNDIQMTATQMKINSNNEVLTTIGGEDCDTLIIAKMNLNGALSPFFGNMGLVSDSLPFCFSPMTETYSGMSNITICADNNIIVGSSKYEIGDSTMSLTKYDESGSNLFQGISALEIGLNKHAYSINQLANGKILITGNSYDASFITGAYGFVFFLYEECFNPSTSNVEILEKTNIKAFPNPCYDILNIQTSAENLPGVVSIVSMDGRVISENNYCHEQLQLDVKRLEYGQYIIKFQGPLETSIFSFIKAQ
jgi:uncharacterized delta-60 repeat protein